MGWLWLGQHPAQGVGLHVGQHRHEGQHGDGVQQGEPEQVALVAHHVRGRGGHGDGLREIILPVTPPEELEATHRAGSTPIWLAVVCCRLPNSRLDEVSEPVRNTPNQPRIGAKNGNQEPVAVKARPRVELMPE